MECPNCGDKARDEQAVFCSTCGNRLKLSPSRSGYVAASGALLILATTISVSITAWGSLPFLLSRAMRLSPSYGLVFAVFLFDLIAFGLGVLGGVNIFRRQHFSLSLVGVSLVLASSFLLLPVASNSPLSLIFGAPVFFFATLALVCLAYSRREFI
jgi:hypothetical protein